MDELKDVYAKLTETHLAELFCSPSKHRFSSLILRVDSLFWEDVPWFPYLLVQNNNCWSERCGACLMSKYRECFLLCCFHPLLIENLSYNRADKMKSWQKSLSTRKVHSEAAIVKSYAPVLDNLIYTLSFVTTSVYKEQGILCLGDCHSQLYPLLLKG